MKLQEFGVEPQQIVFLLLFAHTHKNFLDGGAFDPDILGSLAGGVFLQSVVLAWSALQLKMSRAKQMPSDCSPA